MANIYDVGDVVRLSAVFTVDDVKTDPTTVKVEVRSPAGTTTTYEYGTDPELVKDAVGGYHADVDVDEGGTWYYRWTSTGTAKAGGEGHLDVRRPAF